jgi:iron complex outermembrane receptor protein
VEFDAQYQPNEHLSLYASGAFDDAIYAKYPTAPCGLETITAASCNLSGRPLAGTPKFTASFGGEYSQPVTLAGHRAEAYVGADDTYRSAIYSAATDSVYSRLPALNLVNARIGVRSPDRRWDAYLWSKNLFDKKYLPFISAGVGNTGALYAQVGDPQTVGVTVRYHY